MSAETIFITAFMVLVSVVGTVGNVLVISAILYKRSLRTINNYFLSNLAVSDLLTVSVAVPFRLVEGFQPGSIPCSIVIAVTILFDGLSRINIILISIDRFIAVKFPFTYTLYMTPRIVAVLIVIGWLVLAAFATLPILGVGSAPPEVLRRSQGLCFFSTNLSTHYLLVFLIVFCLLPVIVATPVNCFLLKASYRQMRVIQVQHLNVESTPAETYNLDVHATNLRTADSLSTSTIRQQNCRRKFQLKQRKVVRMVVVLIGLFIVLVLPITLIDILEVSGQSTVPPIAAKIAVCMIYTNSTINAFVYAGFNTDFRRTFVQLIQAGRNTLRACCAMLASKTNHICVTGRRLEGRKSDEKGSKA